MDIYSSYPIREMQSKKILSSFLDKCFCVLLLFPFCQPEGLTYMLDYDGAYIWIGSFFILLLVALPSMRYLNKACWFYALFYLCICFSTGINHRDLMSAVILSGKMVSFLILINYYAKRRKLRTFFIVMKRFLGAIILITVFVQFFYQDAFGFTASNNTVNFLTSDNFLGYWYIPFILAVYLSNTGKRKRKRIQNMCFWVAICIASLIRAWAATCLSIFVIFSVLILARKCKIVQILSPLTALVANMSLPVLIIFVQIQKYFEWLIVGILHKDLTLSYRTYVWAAAIANILQKPLLGHGTNAEGRLSINHFSADGRSITLFSHNVFLEILVQGGIVALVLFSLIYINAHQQLKKVPHDSDLKRMLCISVFSLLLMQFSEFAIYTPIANLPLILCFFYKDLQREGFEGPIYQAEKQNESRLRRV